MKVSILIVYYSGKDKLISCLKSIKNSKTAAKYEVLVVNNSKRHIGVRGVKVLSPGKNLGYGGGNNLAARYAKGEYLLILNPDTEVTKGAIDGLVSFLDKNKKAAAAAPNLIDESGKVYKQLGSSILSPLEGIVVLSFLNKLFPENKISKKYWLSDVPTDRLREVAVVPGSAFMVKKEAFKKVGGYDEKMFLYFEESDLGKRLKGAGYKLYIVPQARVYHAWTKSNKRKKFFEESRYYYFKKHYGYLAALVVEAFARFSKLTAILLIILGVSVFLRFFRLPENMVFHGELGHNYLAIKNMFETGTIPLLGPPTSHPWLSFGPLYYWLFGPIFRFFGGNPVIGAYFFAVLGVVLVFVNYLVVGKFLGKKTALISSFLIAVSPLFLEITRSARFFSLVILAAYGFLYFAMKEKYFWAGLLLGISLNFHLSAIFLLFLLFYSALHGKGKRKERLGKAILGLLIPFIPVFIYEAGHGFLMTSQFLTWIPYRIAGFLGFYPKNNLDSVVLTKNLKAIGDFLMTIFIFK